MTDKQSEMAAAAQLAVGSLRDAELFRNLKSPAQSHAEWNASETRRLYREQGRNLIEVIMERIKTLEAKLQPDQELLVYCDAGRDRIRINQFEFPTWNLAVMIGLDENGNETHRIENVQDVKLTCKILKSDKAGRHPIGFVLPAEKK